MFYCCSKHCNMKRTIIFFALVASLLACQGTVQESDTNSQTISISDEDLKMIEGQAKNLPLILSNEGWDAYESNFSKDYNNWSMVGDKVRSRDEFFSPSLVPKYGGQVRAG